MIMSIESGWLIKNSQFNQWISVEHFSKFTVFFFYIFLCSSPSNRIAMWVVHNPIRTFIYYAHNKKWTSLVVDLSHHITTFFCSCASSIFYFSMEWSWVLSMCDVFSPYSGTSLAVRTGWRSLPLTCWLFF